MEKHFHTTNFWGSMSSFNGCILHDIFKPCVCWSPGNKVSLWRRHENMWNAVRGNSEDYEEGKCWVCFGALNTSSRLAFGSLWWSEVNCQLLQLKKITPKMEVFSRKKTDAWQQWCQDKSFLTSDVRIRWILQEFGQEGFVKIGWNYSIFSCTQATFSLPRNHSPLKETTNGPSKFLPFSFGSDLFWRSDIFVCQNSTFQWICFLFEYLDRTRIVWFVWIW